MQSKCEWENTGDYEYVTSCHNEFYGQDMYVLEEQLQVLFFVYCPYCGKKIEYHTTKHMPKCP